MQNNLVPQTLNYSIYFQLLFPRIIPFHISAQAALAFTFCLQSQKVNKKVRRSIAMNAKRLHYGGKKITRYAQTDFLSVRLHYTVLNAIAIRRFTPWMADYTIEHNTQK